MKLSFLSSVLLLGETFGTAAATKAPIVFGRSMRKRSTINRIRHYGDTAAKKVSDPRRWVKTSKLSEKSAVSADESAVTVAADKSAESKTAKRSRMSADRSGSAYTGSKSTKVAKVGSNDGFGSKSAKVVDIMSYDFDQSVGAVAADKRAQSKTAKRSVYRSKSTPVVDIMSYDFDPSTSMPLSFDFSMPLIESPTTVSPPTTAADEPQESSADESSSDEHDSGQDWGLLIFEYVSLCAGIDLTLDTCLASKTIDAFMSMDDLTECGVNGRLRSLQASNGSRRFLQSSDGGLRFLQESTEVEDEDCCLPDVTEKDLRPVIDVAKQQCVEEGFDISNEEYTRVLYTFMRLFASKGCWESLCSEGSNPSGIFFELLFGEAAQCAGVEMDVNQCAMDHIFHLIFDAGSEEQDSEPCSQPTEADFEFFVAFMLLDAEAHCAEEGVTLTKSEWNKAHSDLVNVFSASQCWGISDCDEEPEVGLIEPANSSKDYNYWPTYSPVYDDEKDSRFVVTDNGHQCIYEIDTDPELERSLELPFFYQIETVSAEEPSETLDNIERALIVLACSDGRRTRVLNEVPHDTDIVAVDSSPDDIVSTDYACSPKHPDAASCYIVEGKVTLILEGLSTESDEEIKLGVYSKLQELFVLLPRTLGDPDVVDVKYIGKNPPLVTPGPKNAPVDDAPDDAPSTVDNLNKLNQDDSGAYTALLIATAGGLVAMAMLITGFHRMNKAKEEMQRPLPSDEKSNDGSNDGQSTANNTADLTYAPSCDRSEISSLSSPTHSLDGALSPIAHRNSPAKYFVVAEEEEENWRDLSILPALAQDDGTLEEVSEEGEFVNSISSDSSCEMSV